MSHVSTQRRTQVSHGSHLPLGSRRIDRGTIQWCHHPQRWHQAACSKGVERSMLVVLKGQFRWRTQHHRDHAVMACRPTDQTGVAVDSSCHGQDNDSARRQF